MALSTADPSVPLLRAGSAGQRAAGEDGGGYAVGLDAVERTLSLTPDVSHGAFVTLYGGCHLEPDITNAGFGPGGDRRLLADAPTIADILNARCQTAEWVESRLSAQACPAVGARTTEKCSGSSR